MANTPPTASAEKAAPTAPEKVQSLATREKNVVRIPLSAIRVDHKWNARSGGWRDLPETAPTGESDAEPGELTLTDLAKSILLHGQDTAVFVRKNPKGTKHEFDLIAGFRRYEALELNAKKGEVVPGWTSVKEPTIIAVIKEVTEAQAQALNLRENTERNGLSPADLAFRIAEIRALHKKETGAELSKSSVADFLGLSPGYTGRLITVWEAQSDEINDAWRKFKPGVPIEKGGDPLSVEKRKALAKFPKGSPEQKKAYEDLIAIRVPDPSNDSWMKSSQSQARRVGFFLARLVREKSVKIEKPDFMRQVKTICTSSQGMFSVPGDPEPTQKQWEILADALQSGWIEGGKADPPPAPEPAPKADKADKADAAKAGTKAPDAPKSSPAAAAPSKNGEHKEQAKKA
jgi:ParB/RepB/Spo0J family partition protein